MVNEAETDNKETPSAPDPAAATDTDSKIDAPLNAREELGEFAKTCMIALVLAMIIRCFLLEPFNIPSSSMKPTLQIGDYLFVNKPIYGYGQFSFAMPFNTHIPAPFEGRVMDGKSPQRGDVVVFYRPTVGQNYIKRVIGLPGEKVQVLDGQLYINRRRVPREPVGLKKIEELTGTVTMMEYIETLPGGVIHRIYEETDDRPLDNTREFVVPEGHYFVMGDNRDNSQDSRVDDVGAIPAENIVGKASFIFFSTNGHAGLAEFWKWPWSVRYNRLFTSLDPVRPDHD